MSINVDLANAITAKLNDDANNFSMAFEARRRALLLTPKELDNLKTIDVLVFPGTVKAELVSREGCQRTYKPSVVFAKKLEGTDEESETAEVDALIELAEEIEAVLENVNFDIDGETLAFQGFDEEQDRVPFNPEMLTGLKVFQLAITLEYLG